MKTRELTIFLRFLNNEYETSIKLNLDYHQMEAITGLCFKLDDKLKEKTKGKGRLSFCFSTPMMAGMNKNENR